MSIVKLLLVGHQGSGKSTISKSLRSVTGPSSPTIGLDFHEIVISELINSHGKHKITEDVLHVIDTAGDPRFSKYIKSYFRDTNIFFLVMDITSTLSLNMAELWLSDIFSYFRDYPDGEKPKILLIGTHKDMEGSRQFTAEDVRKSMTFMWESRLNIIGYVECNAKSICSEADRELMMRLMGKVSTDADGVKFGDEFLLDPTIKGEKKLKERDLIELTDSLMNRTGCIREDVSYLFLLLTLLNHITLQRNQRTPDIVNLKSDEKGCPCYT